MDLAQLGPDGVDFLVGCALLLLGRFHCINHSAQVTDNVFEVLLDLFHMIDQRLDDRAVAVAVAVCWCCC